MTSTSPSTARPAWPPGRASLPGAIHSIDAQRPTDDDGRVGRDGGARVRQLAERGPVSAPAPAAGPAASGSDQVVAEVGGRKITLAEVDAKWQEFDAAERARLRSCCTRAAGTCSTW